MPSISSKIMYKMMKTFKFNQILKRDLENNTLKDTSKQPHSYFMRSGNIETFSTQDHNVYLMTPKTDQTNKWILYLHGGAYVHGFQSFHWRFLRKVMKETGWNIVAPDYPLLPLSTSKDMYTMIIETYQWLLEHKKPQEIIFMGDSAGGGLALGLSLVLKKEKRTMPDEIILMSPWLDVTMTDPKVKEIEPFDPILNVDALKIVSGMLVKNEDPMNHLFSPLYGDLKDMPHITIITGTYDLLYADATRIEEQLTHLDVPYQMIAYDQMIHTFMFFGLPESSEAIKKVVQTVKDV